MMIPKFPKPKDVLIAFIVIATIFLIIGVAIGHWVSKWILTF